MPAISGFSGNDMEDHFLMITALEVEWHNYDRKPMCRSKNKYSTGITVMAHPAYITRDVVQFEEKTEK